jgi:Flp pilus assembly protein TadG
VERDGVGVGQNRVVMARLALSTALLPPGLDEGGASWVRRPSRGQATIELTLALPLMLLLFLGAVDVGRVFFDYVGLRNAAMDGAIYGARHVNATEAEIKQRVRDHYLPDTFPTGATIPVASREAGCSSVNGADSFVTVTVSREFRPISLELLQFVAPDNGWVFTVRPTAKARCMT